MRFTATDDDGAEVDFECADTLVSRWVCRDILAGVTYPWIPFLRDVRVIVDAGANCGAASVYFARHCPDARLHAFEPGSLQRMILDRNVADYPNVSVHPFGLDSTDRTAELHRGLDLGTSSVFRGDHHVADSETIALRDAGAWARDAGIDRIDVLKLDVEGCEVEVLRSLESLLPTLQVLYVEYDSRQARREIEQLMLPTHELYSGRVLLDQGEVIYLRSDLAERPEAQELIVERFNRAAFATSG